MGRNQGTVPGKGAGENVADRFLKGSGEGSDLMEVGEGGGEVVLEFSLVGFFERIETAAFCVFGAILVGVLPVDETAEVLAKGLEPGLLVGSVGKAGGLAEDGAVGVGSGGGGGEEIWFARFDGGLFFHHGDDVGGGEADGI